MAEIFKIEIDGQVVSVEADDLNTAYSMAQQAASRESSLRGTDARYLTNPDDSFRMSPDGGLIADPRTQDAQIKQRQTIDTLTDPKNVIPAVTETIGGVAGSLGGAMIGAPTGVGAGATALAGDATLSGAGRYVGERIVGTSHEDAWRKSREAAGWSAAGGTLVELTRLGRGMFAGFKPALKPSEIGFLKELRPEYEDIARRLNTAPRADMLRDWNVTGPGRDKEQVELVRKIGRSLLDPETSDDEARRVAGDYDALARYLNPEPSPGISYQYDAGKAFEDAIDQEYREVVGAVEGELAVAQRRAALSASRLPMSADGVPIGQQAAIALQEYAQTQKQAVDAAYRSYRELIGQPDPSFPNTNKYGLGPTQQVSVPAWFKKYSKDVAAAANDQNLTDSQRASFSAIQNSLFSKDARVDLAALDDILYHQNKKVTNLKANKDAGVQLIREQSLLNNLKLWRDEISSELSPEINAAYASAQRAYGEYADKFKHGLVGSMLSYNRDGKIVLSDPTKLIKLFDQGSVGDIQQVLGIANEHPALRNELRKLAFAHYRAKAVKEDGSIDLKKHQDYMKPYTEGGYRELTKGFFEDREWKLLDSAGGYAKLMFDKECELKDTLDSWNKLMGGRLRTLDDVSPQRFVTMLFATEKGAKSMEPGHVRYAKHLLEKYHPESLPAYQNAVRQRVLQHITDPESGEFKLGTLKNMLSKEGPTGKNLEIVLGEDYVKSLTNVVGYLERMRGQRLLPGGIGRTELGGPDVVKSIRRGYFGVLSREGLMASIAGEFRNYANNRAIYQALTDPEYLKYMERHYARLAYSQAAGGLIGLHVLRPEDENTDD